MIALRALGALDMMAIAAVVMPHSGIAWLHELAGLGELRDEPLVGYLVRSSSTLYALHGLLVFYMSFDVMRYWRLIRLMGLLALLHGALMLGIDVVEGMPRWWAIVEGPAFAMTGVLVLTGQWWSAARLDSPGANQVG